MLDLRQRDKQQHLLAGLLLTAVMYPFIGYLAVAGAIVVGVIKGYVIDEILPQGYPDVWNLAATTLGILLAGGMILLLGL